MKEPLLQKDCTMYMKMIWSFREKSSSRKLECLRSAGSLWKDPILRRCDQKIRAVKLMYQVTTRLPVKIQKAQKLRKALFLLVSAIRKSKVSQTRDMHSKILWPKLQQRKIQVNSMLICTAILMTSGQIQIRM